MPSLAFSFHWLVLPPAMLLQSYVPCTCESFNGKYNPHGSGQKLQNGSNGYQAPACTRSLGPSHAYEVDALGQENCRKTLPLLIVSSMAHAGSGYCPTDDAEADSDDNPDYGNDGVGDEDIDLPEGEMGRAYPADDSDPGAFSCNPDAEIFELNLEDSVNSDEEMLTEGNRDGDNEFCHESMMTSD
ncbi:uncharacterized protein HD556DRAFT_1314780 [Suillus plorans]|uniref:Uncharacterized protein n=1 Tax=Suillus plorans TaxID=116603 RepID=A0A9P7DAB0_9AGAM|nr:uncharacterized protein HD556DRAFT_1314780 [Suillus plorans]KAG1784817.1 hypothetical protein HD556DRAFT_1314780 [Suillus plorans]